MRGSMLFVGCAIAVACRLPTREADENAPVRPSSQASPIATAPAPQPTPPPTPAAEIPDTPVPAPDVALDGRWPIRQYAVELDAPAGTWLSSYHHAFGLDLAFGEGGKFRRNRSAIEIRTNCEGRCDPGTFDERIPNEKATRAFGLVEQPRVEWIVRPTKLRDGAWWMHIRGLDDEGNTAVESVEFAFMSPQSDNGWLECVLRLEGPELARLDELTQWCRDLPWTYVGEDEERVDARFGGRYPLETTTLELPAIAGFRLEEYAPAEGRLRFRGEENVLDGIGIGTTCHGMCTADRLQANLEQAVEERIASKSDVFVEVPLQSPAPGMFRMRLRSSFAGGQMETHVTRIRPGDDHMTQCTVTVHGDAIARTDELEAACTKALTSLR